MGKYIHCRAKADAKAVKTGDPADYAKCDAKLAGKWAKLESAAGGQCPSTGDLAAIQAYATQCTADLGLGLGGGTLPNCPADLTACSGDLGTCAADLATCQAGGDYRPEKTGQTGCWDATGTPIACAGTGQDGEYQYGRPVSAQAFTDNGDGTITDDKTGLMWEKLSADAHPQHYYWTTWSWADAFNKVAALNSAAFAGHTDWRLPNKNELFSLVDLETLTYRAGFLSSCISDCTVLTCNCGRTTLYWSSTTYEPVPAQAWSVLFDTDGFYSPVFRNTKTSGLSVRAVRGGS